MTGPHDRINADMFQALRNAGTGIQFFKENPKKHTVSYHEKRWDDFTRISIDFEPEEKQITLLFDVKSARLDHLMEFKRDLSTKLKTAGIERNVEPGDDSVKSKQSNTTKGAIWVSLPFSPDDPDGFQEVAAEARTITDAMRGLRGG